MKKNDISVCLKAIDRSWGQLRSKANVDGHSTITLPHPFISPSVTLFHGDQFYWDSYFIIAGLLAEGKVELAQGMVDNLLHLVEEYGFVPMRNRTYDTGISQPPFLTTMIKAVYEFTEDDEWFESSMNLAQTELDNYWRNDDPQDHVADHQIYKGLSRYADHHVIDQTAEHESGWDMTSRFHNQALQFLPIDLNSLLYRYERDLADFFESHGNHESSRRYSSDAAYRKKIMNELMWSNEVGFFFDYNYETRKRSHFYSLAGYFPMWAELASQDQAEKLVNQLEVFETPHGLATTQKDDLILPYKQWDHPNGWAPLHWIVINALESYGYHKEAERIALKWITLVTDVFKKTGKFWEKYNVVDGTVGKKGRYETQSGFGWTNAVYVALTKKYQLEE